MASLIRRVEDLVVEDREIQCETETDRMSWCKVSGSNFGGSFVGLQRLVGGDLALVAKCKLGEITVIVTLPVLSFSHMHDLG